MSPLICPILIHYEASPQSQLWVNLACVYYSAVVVVRIRMGHGMITRKAAAASTSGDKQVRWILSACLPIWPGSYRLFPRTNTSSSSSSIEGGAGGRLGVDMEIQVQTEEWYTVIKADKLWYFKVDTWMRTRMPLVGQEEERSHSAAACNV